jgi:hypothetical protein
MALESNEFHHSTKLAGIKKKYGTTAHQPT